MKTINTLLLLFCILFTNAQEKGTGYIPTTKEDFERITKINNTYLQGGHKIYKMSMKTYGDASSSAFDLRTIDAVSPVRDQGVCGSCWTFSSIAAIETSNKLINGESTDLSEQFILNCSNKGTCLGGNPILVFDWLFGTNTKLITEANLPYRQIKGQCSSTTSSDIRLANFGVIGYDPSTLLLTNPTINEVKEAIVTHGSLSGALWSKNSEFMSYKGDGVLRGNNFGQADHVVSIIGWDDDKNAWLIRNSWGTKWGDNGYGWLGYNSFNLSELTWVDVVRNDAPPTPSPMPEPKKKWIEIDFSHILGSLQIHQELFVKIDDREPQYFGMNKKGVKYHNKVYVEKGRHEFIILIKSIIMKDDKKSMIFGLTSGKIKAKKNKAYKIVYKSRIKQSNVFKIVLEEDDLKVNED